MILTTIIHIIVYAIVGLIPVLYNYYFIKDKVRKLRKFYLDKLRKHSEELRKALENNVKYKSPSTPTTPSYEGVGEHKIVTTVYSYKVPVSQETSTTSTHQNYIQPYTITLTSHVSSPLTTTTQQQMGESTSTSPHYVILIITDKNTILNTTVISNIISSIPQVLAQVNKVQTGYVGSNDAETV